MKAYVVSDRRGDYGSEIVYAETAGKAKALCLYDEKFDDCEWTDLRAQRFQEYDQYYNGESKVDFWRDDEHRVRLVKDYAWQCIDPIDSYCRECPAKEWCDYGRRAE